MTRIRLIISTLLATGLLLGGLLLALSPQDGSLPRPLAAAPLPSPTAQPEPAITVIGEGSASARPDQAWIAVGVQVSKPTAAEALTAANQTTEAVLARLDQVGIPRATVQTSGISLFPMLEGGPKPGSPEPSLTGYQASHQLTILVGDLSRVGEVLDGVVAAGATQVIGVRFGLRDDSVLRAQALQAAVTAARPKAEALAARLQRTAGSVLAVREEGSFSPLPAGQVGGKGGAVPIEPGQLTAHVQVQVTFALAPAP